MPRPEHAGDPAHRLFLFVFHRGDLIRKFPKFLKSGLPSLAVSPGAYNKGVKQSVVIRSDIEGVTMYAAGERVYPLTDPANSILGTYIGALRSWNEKLTGIKSFGVFLRRPGLHSSYSKDGKKHVFGKPMLFRLTAEPFQKDTDFFPAYSIAQANIVIRRTEITVVFRDFVFQNEMAPKCIPRQIRYQAMVLMKVVTIMGENKVRLKEFLFLKYSSSKPYMEKTVLNLLN
jgi:hypothetical protein